MLKNAIYYVYSMNLCGILHTLYETYIFMELKRSVGLKRILVTSFSLFSSECWRINQFDLIYLPSCVINSECFSAFWFATFAIQYTSLQGTFRAPEALPSILNNSYYTLRKKSPRCFVFTWPRGSFVNKNQLTLSCKNSHTEKKVHSGTVLKNSSALLLKQYLNGGHPGDEPFWLHFFLSVHL